MFSDIRSKQTESHHKICEKINEKLCRIMNIYENIFMEVIRMLVGYMRVSTEEQTTSLQKDALLKYGVDERNIFADVVSGASKKS